jgi:hypothetical protein
VKAERSRLSKQKLVKLVKVGLVGVSWSLLSLYESSEAGPELIDIAEVDERVVLGRNQLPVDESW